MYVVNITVGMRLVCYVKTGLLLYRCDVGLSYASLRWGAGGSPWFELCPSWNSGDGGSPTERTTVTACSDTGVMSMWLSCPPVRWSRQPPLRLYQQIGLGQPGRCSLDVHWAMTINRCG